MTTQNSPNTATASGGMKLHPPVGNDLLAAYYWHHHFETGPVEPSPFIHRIMTDYADEEVVGQWIQNMSPLYKLYNACINYGLNHGSPNKSIEARKFPGGSCRGDRAVQYVRNWHRQMRGGPVVIEPAPEGFPWGIVAHMPNLSGTFSQMSISTSPANGEGSSGIVGTVFQPTPSSRRSGGVAVISTDENKRKQEEREVQLMAQRKATEENFQRLKEGDAKAEWPSIEQLQKEYDEAWEACINGLLDYCTVGKDKVTRASHSVHKAVQRNFVEALVVLWTRALRRFCQEAVSSEDFAERRPELLNAIVMAAEKGANKTITSLGNFITDWDFVRFAFLFDRLTKDQNISGLGKVKEAIIACRSARNEFAHPTYNPAERGLPDARLASIVDLTRNCIPKVNKLSESEQVEFYEKLEFLESILFQRPTNQEENYIVVSTEA